MPSIEPDTIDACISRATRSGALQTIRTERAIIEDAGIPFLVRWVSSLSAKDSARVAAAGHRDPDFNPFLPPEHDLTVGPVSDTHLAILNKYPVIERHLLLITRDFEDQRVPLGLADFSALASTVSSLGGLGFYNGGTEAGASQAHKHLQWVPDSPDSVSIETFTAALPSGLAPMSTACHPGLSWKHAFVRLHRAEGSNSTDAGRTMLAAFRRGAEHVGIDPDANPMPPYNMLTGNDWMLVLPRSRERYEDISVNALGFAGSLFVRSPSQIETIRRMGPLQLLAEVACR